MMTTDSGSLLNLGNEIYDDIEEDNIKFYVTCYSEGYASPKYVDAVINQKPLTRDELMREDMF